MTRFKVLVIDDDLDRPARRGKQTRREHYYYLNSAFELSFLEKIEALPDLLKLGDIHGILADFVLDKWGTDIRSILAQLGGQYPVGLISSHWAPSFEELRLTLHEYPNDVAQLFTWEDLEVVDRRGLVVIWLEKAIRERLGYGTVVLNEREPLRILHLSDLQFGGALPTDFVTETHLIAEKIRQIWQSPPTFIALTGDAAEHGLPSEFAMAKDWLEDLARNLDPKGWSRERFLIIPGNHDLCWPLGWSAKVDIGARRFSESSVRDSSLLPYALEPFRKFASELNGEVHWIGDKNYWVLGKHRHLGVIFYGYNTCEDVDEWCEPRKAIMDPTFGRMFAEVRKYRSEADGALILGLMHHPVLGEPKDTIVNPQVLYKNISTEPSTVVILSGHFHDDGWKQQESGSGSLLELTASTVARGESHRPADSARGLSLIELRRENYRVSAVSVTHCQFDRTGLSVGQKVTFKRGQNGKLSHVG
jgi:hypothetical protein